MKVLKNVDKIAYGALIASAIGSVIMDVADTNPNAEKGKDKNSGPKITWYHGLLGAAALYKIARTIAPKTRYEKRMIKMAQMYDMADAYGKRAKGYRRAAEKMFSKRFKHMKPALSH